MKTLILVIFGLSCISCFAGDAERTAEIANLQREITALQLQNLRNMNQPNSVPKAQQRELNNSLIGAKRAVIREKEKASK